MFTLPVDKILDFGEAPLGKINQICTWNLTAIIQPGVLKNLTKWCPGEDHKSFHECSIVLEIFFANECLLATRLDNNRIVFSKNIPDTDVPTVENLIIKLSGIPDNNGTDQVVIKIDVTIEDLSMEPLFETQGYYLVNDTQERKVAGNFLGENGQQFLEIYTPIYVWLLKNYELFQKEWQW